MPRLEEAKTLLAEVDKIIKAGYLYADFMDTMSEVPVPPEIERSIRHLAHYMIARNDMEAAEVAAMKDAVLAGGFDG